jgi:hypothetical protein
MPKMDWKLGSTTPRRKAERRAPRQSKRKRCLGVKVILVSICGGIMMMRIAGFPFMPSN